NGGGAAFFDAEHAFDSEKSPTIGGDIDNLYFLQPDHGGKRLENPQAFLEGGQVVFLSLFNILPRPRKKRGENMCGGGVRNKKKQQNKPARG
ncbi:hypothetical protein EY01_14840, partial [Staphylococcus aureus]